MMQFWYTYDIFWYLVNTHCYQLCSHYTSHENCTIVIYVLLIYVLLFISAVLCRLGLNLGHNMQFW